MTSMSPATASMLLYRQQGKWTIAPLGPPPPPDSTAKPGGGPAVRVAPSIPTTSRSQTDPRAEWTEMYHEAFRLQRAFFYDPSYHGLDLDGDGEVLRALPRRPRGPRRPELSVRGDARQPHRRPSLRLRPDEHANEARRRNGLLGADYTIDNGRYRFAKVYAGRELEPAARGAPLTQPGVNVREGEYLLAVNGRTLDAKDKRRPGARGHGGQIGVIRVGPNAGRHRRPRRDGGAAAERDAAAAPGLDRGQPPDGGQAVGRQAGLRLPAQHGGEGYTRFNRYFFAQLDKQARSSTSGSTAAATSPTTSSTTCGREAPFNYVTARDGEDVPIPAGAIYGPKAMLINEYAGLGRRRAAVAVPPVQGRPAGRQADLGRAGRHRRLPAADGRRRWSPRRASRSGLRRASRRSRTRAWRRTSRSTSTRRRGGRGATRSWRRPCRF